MACHELKNLRRPHRTCTFPVLDKPGRNAPCRSRRSPCIVQNFEQLPAYRSRHSEGGSDVQTVGQLAGHFLRGSADEYGSTEFRQSRPTESACLPYLHRWSSE